MKTWINYLDGDENEFLFPNAQRKSLTRHGVEYRLKLAKKLAEMQCPSLKKKHITPHSIRHTTAVHLLQSGIDINVIALWLGHENNSTTHMYLEADLAMKEKTLQKLKVPKTKSTRFQAKESLIQFLESL